MTIRCISQGLKKRIEKYPTEGKGRSRTDTANPQDVRIQIAEYLGFLFSRLFGSSFT